MQDLRCSFSMAVMAESAVCEHAEQVVRRGGYEIACKNSICNAQCQDLSDHLKEHIFPELGYDNDLLTVPHSLLQKLQIGGISCLQQLVNNDSNAETNNIAKLPEQLLKQFGEYQQLPYANIIEQVKSTQIKKRRRNK